ncbi:hypothetical protein CEXT_387971 [Caerostris extrusa]|uniref:Uncharacterized protein n=1 Tax=Caerostris extrusa TaxID=172846 RepID=A0AAV4WBD3_CAEEX|nr:hypothetical protein CEXT_387971 [Caerostris extrusa]
MDFHKVRISRSHLPPDSQPRVDSGKSREHHNIAEVNFPFWGDWGSSETNQAKVSPACIMVLCGSLDCLSVKKQMFEIDPFRETTTRTRAIRSVNQFVYPATNLDPFKQLLAALHYRNDDSNAKSAPEIVANPNFDQSPRKMSRVIEMD